MLKEYGDLLGTEEAHAFSARVADVHEWVAERLDRLLPFGCRGEPVIVQDPCHLRHVQRADGAVKTVLAPFVPVVELDDEGLCCGAGGAFAFLQPDLAAKVRDLKVAAIDRAATRSGAAVVVSANPGCSFYLGAAGYQVMHPLEVVAERLAATSDKEMIDGN
jgi:glycolate oxidase iron-sulfur subunit